MKYALRVLFLSALAVLLALSFSLRPARAADNTLDDPAHQADLQSAFLNHWIPTFYHLAQQLSLSLAYQAAAIGPMLDAKNQLETQLLMQGMAAEAHRDYQPSDQMCRFGTNIRSLIPAEIRWRTNARLLDLALMKRTLLNGDVVSAGGHSSEKRSRIGHFREKFCDKFDNNNNLGFVCTLPMQPRHTNADIDFIRTVENRYTIDFDLMDTAPPSTDEENILALGRNLFAHQTFPRIPERHTDEEYAKDELMEMRSADAIRSVIRNSFGHIVGMRAKGDPGQVAAPFMKNMIAEMGVPVGEINEFLGENPSYFAQMEVLTKKMYQTPEFFSGLYTTPANVKRTAVALKAIQIMQDRDRFEAALRREMLISLLLEMKIREAQTKVNTSISDTTSTFLIDPAE